MFYDQPPLEEASCISQKIDMSATGSKALSLIKASSTSKWLILVMLKEARVWWTRCCTSSFYCTRLLKHLVFIHTDQSKHTDSMFPTLNWSSSSLSLALLSSDFPWLDRLTIFIYTKQSNDHAIAWILIHPSKWILPLFHNPLYIFW